MVTNRQVNQTKIKQENARDNWYYKPNGSMDIYRTFHLDTKEYTLLASHGTVSITDHILGQVITETRKLKQYTGCYVTTVN